MYCKTDNSYSHSGNVRQIVGSCKKIISQALVSYSTFIYFKLYTDLLKHIVYQDISLLDYRLLYQGYYLVPVRTK